MSCGMGDEVVRLTLLPLLGILTMPHVQGTACTPFSSNAAFSLNCV